jgi:3-polyprenyl-4-hydroxybenzoate decarboxylase
MRTTVQGKTILLIVGGGIAAFKTLELVRELGRAGARVLPVLTENGARFVTPLSLSALAGEKVRTSLWDLEDEAAMGHIQLSRAADLVVVCPATASLMARAAAGIADDLATTLLLATDKPVLMVPAMNVRMWLHAATQRNIATLRSDGITVVQPDDGAMACGEFGPGRLPEVPKIMAAIAAQFGSKPLLGRHALHRQSFVGQAGFRHCCRSGPSGCARHAGGGAGASAHPRRRHAGGRDNRAGHGGRLRSRPARRYRGDGGGRGRLAGRDGAEETQEGQQRPCAAGADRKP